MPQITYTLKGFVTYSALIDNSPFVTAPLGELSTYGKTFAKDIQVYSDTAGSSSNVQLHVFSSVDDTENAAVPPSDYVNELFGVFSWIYNQAVNSVFTADTQAFRDAFLTEFPMLVDDVIVYRMEGADNFWMPESIDLYLTDPSVINPSYTDNSRVRVWLSNDSFVNSYDIYQIEFVPPIDNLDDFFLGRQSVENAVNQRTLPQTMDKIALVRDNHPETVLDTRVFNWINPDDNNDFIITDWTYLIWGIAGNNVDAIKEALRDYILSNSTHTEQEWQEIFPSIFMSTEYILTPLWNQYAIPNKTLSAGLYSPVVNVQTARLMSKYTAVGSSYTDQHVENVLNVVPTHYKTVSLTAVGNPENINAISEFSKQWVDYLSLPTTSIDYDRMTPATQEFVSLMYSLLNAAENMTEASDLPHGIVRMTRKADDGKDVMFAVATLNRISYLVVTKQSVVDKWGELTYNEGSIGIVYDGVFSNGAYQLLSTDGNMVLQMESVNAQGILTWSILDTTADSATIDINTGLMEIQFPSEGKYTVTMELLDGQAQKVTRTIPFQYTEINASGNNDLNFGAVSLPEGAVGVSYDGTIHITGGIIPYTIVSASLPDGLTATMEGLYIKINGTPTQATATAGMDCVIHIKDSSEPIKQQTSLAFAITIV